MRLLVTGASGFVGRHVVALAARRGHRVLAMTRSVDRGGHPNELQGPGVEIVEADLSFTDGLSDVVRGVDCVVHLAAARAGDAAAQHSGTVLTTRHLLDAMAAAGVRRIVLVSSFSVYDYGHMRVGDLLDELSPLLDVSAARDAYSGAKRAQEELVRDTASRAGWAFAVLRPGAIYGPGHIWTARLGVFASSRWWVRIGCSSRLPLTFVENCAEAIVLAAERTGPMALIVNIVDDDPPTQREYCGEVFRRLRPRPRSVIAPLTLVRAAAHAASMVNQVFFRGRARLPAVLVPSQLDARFKPLRFSNKAAVAELAWRPRFTLAEALNRTLGSPPGAVSPPPGVPPTVAGVRP